MGLGFFSVIDASATVLMAIEWGFKSVMFTALVLYILSAVMYHEIGHKIRRSVMKIP